MDPIHPITPGPSPIPPVAPRRRAPASAISRERDRPARERQQQARRGPPPPRRPADDGEEDGGHPHVDVLRLSALVMQESLLPAGIPPQEGNLPQVSRSADDNRRGSTRSRLGTITKHRHQGDERMGLTINTNLEAMNASRNLNNTENMLSHVDAATVLGPEDQLGRRRRRRLRDQPKAFRARSTGSTRQAKTSRTRSPWRRPLRVR